MATTFQNSGLRSNVIRDARPPIPSDLHGDVIEIQFPTRAVRGVDLAHMPASIIDNYAANTKTMVQNMFNAKNLNENLNYKNTFYLAERDEMANKEANTIFGHEKVYPKQVVDADLKAQYTAKSWKDDHVKSEKKVKDALRQTTDNVSRIRGDEAKEKADEQAKHEKEVKKHFKKVQNLIGTMTGSPKATVEKFHRAPESDETDRIGVQNIERDAHDEEKILNNRANIRTLLGARSQENQDKLQAEREAKEQLLAEEEAERLRIQRQEEKRVEKFMSLEKLSKSWRITDKTKLKEVVRNEIMKEIMKEEERKNFEKIAAFMNKKPDSLIKKPKSKPKPKMEPPKAYSPSSKKNQQQKKKKDEKKYVFSPEKIHKLPAESAADYRARFNFTVMALPEQKKTLDPVEQHEITKKFQEMIVKNGVERNGKIVLESKRTI